MPEGLKKGPEGSRSKEKDAILATMTILAKTQPHKLFENWFKLAKIAAHTRVRIKRLVITPLRGVIPPPSGVVREPGSRRLTVRLRKENKLPFRYAVFGWGC